MLNNNISEEKIYIGRTALKIILSNLIFNAVKYSDEYGSINIGSEKGYIYIENTYENKSSIDIYKIFDVNFDLSKKNSKGLGLYIVSSLLKNYKIKYREAQGDSSFKFEIELNRQGEKMFILELYQDGMSTELGLFDTIEEGRKFVSQLKGYKFEEIDGFEYETIKLDLISDYMELEINGNIVPLTKFMFTEDGNVEVYWKEIPNLSKKGKGIVEGATRVDAYTVANSDLREYIESRENNYLEVKKNLENKGYQVERAYLGSEDGEAILFRKKDSEDWHFLTHMDPEFTEEFDLDECLEMVEEDN